MNRVRFPLIVRYKHPNEPYTYGKEDYDEHGFGRTEDELLATVYTSSKMFSRLFGESATQWQARNVNHFDPRYEATTVYVGE